MAKLPPNVRAKRLRSGVTAYYWEVPTKDRKAGCTLVNEALGQDLAPAVLKAIQLNDLLTAWRRGDEGAGAPVPGTVRWLFALVEKHPRFVKTATKTQRSYLQGFRLVEQHQMQSGRLFGDVDVNALEPRHADALYEALQWVEEETDDGQPVRRRRLATANGAMRAARRAWSIGLRAGWCRGNPFLKMGLDTTAVGGMTRPATRAELDAFIAAADAKGCPSMGTAALLAFEMCQREGDVIGTVDDTGRLHGLSWSGYRSPSAVGARAEIRIRQHKTGTWVWVPLIDGEGELFPGLVARLDATPQVGPLIVMRDQVDRRAKVRLPYKEDHFRHLYREIADAAGLDKTLYFMGFRHGGLTELGDAEATDQEMMSLGGHKTRQMLTVYARTTRTQAANAARKRRVLRTESAQSSERGSERA